MKVYITKYALTQGIWSHEALKIKDGRATIKRWDLELYGNGEWAETKEQAIEQFNEKKQKKLISLNKQINKLESLEAKFKEESGGSEGNG